MTSSLFWLILSSTLASTTHRNPLSLLITYQLRGRAIRDKATGKRASLYRFYHTAIVRTVALNPEEEEKVLEFVEQTLKKHNCNTIMPHTINNNMLISSHTQPIFILLFLPQMSYFSLFFFKKKKQDPNKGHTFNWLRHLLVCFNL